ncbi:transposase [Bradyrhizobium sp. cir1]|nr:transposase [Bradyrhizobium sp. cir1]
MKTYLVVKRKIRQFLPGTADIKRIFSFRAGVHRRNQPHRCTHAVLQIRQVYVAKVLIADLTQDAIVVMDNLSSHKGPRVRQMIEAAGARLLYLPPYSPGFNPIENAFAKLKPLLRRGRKTNRSRPLERDWSHHRNRMPQLLHRRRIRCNMIGGCSRVGIVPSGASFIVPVARHRTPRIGDVPVNQSASPPDGCPDAKQQLRNKQ